jgi:hypothetical protein
MHPRTPIGIDDSSNDLVADAGEHAPSTAAGEAEQVGRLTGSLAYGAEIKQEIWD